MRSLRSRLASIKEEFASWHRGLPNDDNAPVVDRKFLAKALRDTTQAYVSGLAFFYRTLWSNLSGRASVKKAEQNHQDEQEAKEAGKAAAKAAKDTITHAPNAFRAWVAPRITLLAAALRQFGEGYTEGSRKPVQMVNIRQIMRESGLLDGEEQQQAQDLKKKKEDEKAKEERAASGKEEMERVQHFVDGAEGSSSARKDKD